MKKNEIVIHTKLQKHWILEGKTIADKLLHYVKIASFIISARDRIKPQKCVNHPKCKQILTKEHSARFEWNGIVYLRLVCPSCSARWSPKGLSKIEVENDFHGIVAQFALVKALIGNKDDDSKIEDIEVDIIESVDEKPD